MGKNHKASLVVKLEGENPIEVNTLINMLTHYVIITERANELVGNGEYKSKVKVKAIERGSFEISLEVITTWLRSVLTKENVEQAALVVSSISLVFELYKHFKGKRISLDEAKVVINKSTTIQNAQTIINVYNDPQTNESLRRSFETAKGDIAVNGVTLIADGKPSETVSEEEFGELSIPKLEDIPNTKIITDSEAILNIISLSFNKGDNWKFIYHGNKIVTKLSDDGLQKAIDQGSAFAKGDALKVELEITQKWNEEYSTYVNEKYKVLNVLEHLQTPKKADSLFL